MSEKSAFDKIIDAVYGKDEALLPDFIALTAIRTGDETEFSYREFFDGLSIEQIRASKVILDYVFAKRFPKAALLISVHEPEPDKHISGPSIELHGRVPTILFGELMSNEFSHWMAWGRISRRTIASMYKLVDAWLRWRSR